MEFLSEPQQQVYEKIAPWMREVFGAFLRERDDAPGFHVVVGSAYASIYVLPWRDDDATVMARSSKSGTSTPTSAAGSNPK